jgi:hypothetical protein
LSVEIIFFGAIAGVLWTLAYILIIRRSILDQSYGMPFLALCANFAWEFVHAFVYPPELQAQRAVHFLWFFLDIGILWAYVRYGLKDFTPLLPKHLFYPSLALGITVSFMLVAGIAAEFNDNQGRYSAFSIDLLMAIMFSVMLLERKSMAGQSLYIGLCMTVGSICYDIIYSIMYPVSPLLHTLFFLTITARLVYLWLIYRQCRAEGIHPLRHI